MGKGSLSIETVIIIVICLFVLILSILYVTRMTGPVSNSTVSTATLYNECGNWRLFGYNGGDTFFNPEKYPALWQTYGSDCIENDDGKATISDEPKCTDKTVEVKDSTEKITRIEDIAKKAKAFCTMEQN